MRKLCLLVVCALLLQFSGVAIAEPVDFSLRSGIQFGDTIETIVKKETTLQRLKEDSYEFAGRIAGYDDASCVFSFDDNGGMTGMNYYFGSEICTSQDTMDDVYKTLYQSLVRKYGNAIGNVGGKCELITGPAIDSMALYVYFIGAIDGYDGDYSDYDEWVVDAKDYHVKIDLVSYYYRDSDNKYNFFVNLSYMRYTDEDYNKALEEKRQERDEVDDDL